MKDVALDDDDDDEEKGEDNYEILEFKDHDIADGDQTDLIYVDNVSTLSMVFTETGTKDPIIWLMALITNKHGVDKNDDGEFDENEDVSGDRKLASLTRDLWAAGLHTHTYNALEDKKIRITRIGATKKRLNDYAYVFPPPRPSFFGFRFSFSPSPSALWQFDI